MRLRQILFPLALVACDVSPQATSEPRHASSPPPGGSRGAPVSRNPCPLDEPILPRRWFDDSIDARAQLSTAQVDGLMRATMSCSADPCVDFYEYACGGYLELARSRPDFGRGASELATVNLLARMNILQVAADTYSTSRERRLLAAYWLSCTDEPRRDADGIDALVPLLRAIDGVHDGPSLTRAVARLHAVGVDAWIAVRVVPDPARTLQAVRISTGRHLDAAGDDSDSAAIEAYGGYVERLFDAAKLDVEGASARVLDVERRLARIAGDHRDDGGLDGTHVDDRRPRGISELRVSIRWFDWTTYGVTTGLEWPDAVIVADALVERFDAEMSGVSVQAVRDYLRAQLLMAFAADLPSQFRAAEREYLWGHRADGAYPVGPACAERASAQLPELMSHYYLGLFWDERSAGLTQRIAAQLLRSLYEKLYHLDWLDEATRDAALQKARMVQIVGPGTGGESTYEGVGLVFDDHLQNVVTLRRYHRRRHLSAIGQPIEAAESRFSGAATNAYYARDTNVVELPGAFFQPPLVMPGMPLSVLYGRVGTVIGHELIHGFDARGRHYDERGRWADWWTNQTREIYDERAACMVDHYESLDAGFGLHASGTRTLAENISDVGGLDLAYVAYQRARREERGTDAPRVGGMTGAQAFFVAWAQSHCQVERRSRVASTIAHDDHTPARARVNGPAELYAPLRQAFGCAPPVETECAPF